MRRISFFVPPQEGNLLNWAINYDEKIPVLGLKIGLAPEVIAVQQQAARVIRDTLVKAQQKKNEFAEAKAAKRLLRSNEIKTICDAVLGYKKYPGFTENIGQELGVISTGSTIDIPSVKATLKLKVRPGYVSVYFNKKGMSGITIFSRLKGSNGWEEIATVKTSPYLDKRPLAQEGIAETREYMARCYDGFNDVGQESDIVFTLFGG